MAATGPQVSELHGLARRFALSYQHADQKLQDALIALLRGHGSLAAQRAALKRAFDVAHVNAIESPTMTAPYRV